jgi:type I restriction enzyme S subunit
LAVKPRFVGERELVKLSEIATIKAGNVAPKKDAFTEDGIPFVRAGSLTNLLAGESLADLEKIDGGTASKLRLTLFPAGTVVFAKSGMSCMTGNVYVLPKPCYVVSHLACVIPNGNYAPYLKHYFRFNRPNRLIENPSFPSIKLSKIQGIELRLPAPEESVRQVQALERIESQIAQAKKLLMHLDSLVKSRFAEMFGDAGWPVATVGSLAVDVRYGTSKKASDCGQYVYLRMNNMTDDGRLNLDDVKHIDLNGPELEKCRVVDGDLLFNRTNSREKVGKTVVFHERKPMVIAGYIIRVRLGDRIRPDFLATYMNLPTTKAMLRSIAKGAVHQANINSRELSAIEVPVPPMELQDRFLSFVAQVDKSRFVVRNKSQL